MVTLLFYIWTSLISSLILVEFTLVIFGIFLWICGNTVGCLTVSGEIILAEYRWRKEIKGNEAFSAGLKAMIFFFFVRGVQLVGDFSGVLFLDLCIGNELNKWIQERRDVCTNKERCSQNVWFVGRRRGPEG